MKKPASANIQTKFGGFKIYVWPERIGTEPIVFTTPEIDTSKSVLVRIHSECITGDNFHAFNCDCAQQKEKALKMISKSRNGIFIYMRQEFVGHGLYKKIKVYKLQENGLDTYAARRKMHLEKDIRNYGIAVKILKYLHVKKINLITNNPEKILTLGKNFVIEKRIPIIIKDKHVLQELKIKKEKYGHLI